MLVHQNVGYTEKKPTEDTLRENKIHWNEDWSGYFAMDGCSKTRVADCCIVYSGTCTVIV